MSSHQLPLNTPADASSRPSLSLVPSHVTLSKSHDLLGAVWQEGRVMLWALQTRITPGRGTVMNPILIWSASLPRECQCRQVLVSSKGDDEEHMTISVAILGSDVGGNDQIFIHDFERVTLPLKQVSETSTRNVSLQQKNGRLIPHEIPEHLAWQAPDGSIFQGVQ
jgi:elongator complex protein 1